MKPETTLFWDVDTQRDFVLPDGRLYAPGAEKIVATLGALAALARRLNIRIAGDVDRHFPGDPELTRSGGPYPDHCMDGSSGQRKIQQTAWVNAIHIENRPLSEAELDAAIAHRGDLVIEKQHVDVMVGNCNAPRLIPKLLRNYRDLVIYGVCTDVCVDFVVRAALGQGPKLHVVTDAIAALDVERAKACLESWRAAEVEMLTFDQLEAALTGTLRKPPRQAPAAAEES